MLLREIAYDYKIAISNSENLTSESAPAIISLALDDESIPLKTKQKLGELLSQLPSSGEVTSDYPIVMNEKVKEKIVLFQTRYHDAFNLWLSRSTKYMPMIRRVFKEEGIPLDIGYLPLVESGFSPSAYSWAKAAGVWQFIVGTSSRYGLKTDWYIDERRDPEKATRAAARYLKDLYKMFGDWELALASYNCGENRVKRLIKENGTSNYWELPLPKETRNYIPLFNAALYIAKDRANTAFIQIIRNHRSMILSG
jgi:membrane-bound lytic murein transglycosylase D